MIQIALITSYRSLKVMRRTNTIIVYRSRTDHKKVKLSYLKGLRLVLQAP